MVRNRLSEIGLDADLLDGQHGSYYLNRANHTGTQTAATISNFDTQVRTSRLDQFAAPTSSINLNGQVFTNAGEPINPSDLATKSYVEARAQGLNPLDPVKAATTGNITLSGLLTIDGITLVNGDRVLVKDQTTNTQNGVYVAASGAWTRATDADVWTELVSSYAFVENGTINKNSGWLCTALPGGTLGTSPIPWKLFNKAGDITATTIGGGEVSVFKQKTGINLEFRSFTDTSSINVTQNVDDTIKLDAIPGGIDKNALGGSALSVANGGTVQTTVSGIKTALGIVNKYSADIGDNSQTTFTIVHNLNSLDTVSQVRYNTTPKSVVEPDIETIDANTTKISFSIAPTVNQFRIIIIG